MVRERSWQKAGEESLAICAGGQKSKDPSRSSQEHRRLQKLQNPKLIGSDLLRRPDCRQPEKPPEPRLPAPPGSGETKGGEGGATVMLHLEAIKAHYGAATSNLQVSIQQLESKGEESPCLTHGHLNRLGKAQKGFDQAKKKLRDVDEDWKSRVSWPQTQKIGGGSKCQPFPATRKGQADGSLHAIRCNRVEEDGDPMPIDERNENDAWRARSLRFDDRQPRPRRRGRRSYGRRRGPRGLSRGERSQENSWNSIPHAHAAYTGRGCLRAGEKLIQSWLQSMFFAQPGNKQLRVAGCFCAVALVARYNLHSRHCTLVATRAREWKLVLMKQVGKIFCSHCLGVCCASRVLAKVLQQPF